MKKLGLNEIREKYLSFFQSKQHLRLPSFSLLPENDKSLLLIPAGMAPLKPYFSGEQTPPAPRITTCQKCIRTNDIDNVGLTARHLTFFEMLGNFSFGDYFKSQACAWAWEFVTQVLEMPVDRLYASIYEEDDEAYDIWTREVGVDPGHVFRMGKADNFWEIGTGSGPCGPCSELYFDRGEQYACGPDCHPGCDCDRYVEFWNLVFTQFENDGSGNYIPLAKKNIDTGMGLERIACIMQDTMSLFEIDTLAAITDKVRALAGFAPGQVPEGSAQISLRIITDHIRATVMLIADGVLPSNEGRGYILRRLLRRASRHGRLLAIPGRFLTQLSDIVFEVSGKAYPDLRSKRDYIRQVISLEEERFDKTIDSGLKILQDLTEALVSEGKTVMNGEDAFRLYDTFGFPVDLTVEILAEKGLTVDRDGFDRLMKQQRERARADRKKAGGLGWEGADASFESVPATIFAGYTALEGQASVVAIAADDGLTDVLEAGAQAAVLLDRTTFYAESGGQAADHGIITAQTAAFEVTDVQKTPDGKYVHHGVLKSGVLRTGDSVKTEVDAARRQSIMRAHTATHLLHAALRHVLGSHVQQAGSLVEPDRLRFDFSHFAGMTAQELALVEQEVNAQILAGLAGQVQEMPIDEAKKLGAMALFGEKYGDTVRVIRFGAYTTELCGGTHLDNTALAGLCRITGESSVAAGVRRVECVTGPAVLAMLHETQALLEQTAAALKTVPGELLRRAEQVTGEVRTLSHALDAANARLARGEAEELLARAEEIGGVRFVAARFDGRSADSLRTLGDMLRDLDSRVVALLAGVVDDKIVLNAVCGKDAVAAGAHAGNLIRQAAKTTGGGGGGRPDSASAGGRDVTKLDEALREAADGLHAQVTK